MREWQVGDPIGDGNDIGVPDTKYMGYLRDNDGESSKDDIVDNFKQYINYAREYYNLQHYEDAFYYLDYSFRTYGKMNNFEKSQARANPFNQDWIIELCCKIINNHGEYYQEATDFIIKNQYSLKLCMDCDCVYPIDYKHCIKCGKPLTKPAGKSPEKIAEELSDILSNKIWDESEIARLVNRSLVLMKSNDCRLVEIRNSNYGIDFIFEKEHKYFKTRYICEYVPGGARVFEDFGVTHNHDKLLADESFKKLIKDTENRTGFKFKKCDGGYGSQLDDNRFNFIFNDRIHVIACFDMGFGETIVYDVDLDNVKLINDDEDLYLKDNKSQGSLDSPTIISLDENDNIN